MYKKILVPLDGSELAEAVLPHVRAWAQGFNPAIYLLRVAHIPVEFIFSDPAVAGNMLADDSASYLAQLADRLRGEGLTVTTQVMNGPVASAILDYADSIPADMIAMSTHGRSGFSRWLVGSVADKVVHGAKVPILLIRPSKDG